MSQELPVDILFSIKNDWSRYGGFTGEISFTNNGSNFEDWIIEFDAPFEITKIWNADIVSHTDNHYVIKNARWNAHVDADKTITFGFNASVDNQTINKPINYIFNQQKLDIDSGGNDGNTPTTPTDNNFIGEIGTITNLNHQGQTIEFKNQYENPVVFALPLSNQEEDPAIARITDIQSDNFSVYVQEAEYKDGFHSDETLSYIVLEAGTWKLNDGTVLQVGKIDTNKTTTSGWKSVNFNTSFNDTPVVLSQVQTDNDSTFVRTRQQQASGEGFQLALEEEETLRQSGHGTETVGWLAIESGEGSWNSMNYQAGTTVDRVTDRWHNLDLNNFSQAPNLLAGLGSYDGGDSAGLRYTNLNSDGVQISIEEDQSLDRETSHTSEIVNFLAIEGEGNLTGVSYDDGNDEDDTPSPPILSSQAIKVDFEKHSSGTKYNRSTQDKDWNVDWSTSSWMNNYATITDKEAHESQKSLRITYRPDARTGGSAAWELPAEKEYYLSYWVKFADNFDFNGSKQSGGKLPGLGGAGGYCSGGQTCNGNNGFSSRYMWREDGRAQLYLYRMDKPGRYGDTYWFEDESGQDVYFEKGKWHNVVQRVKINDGNNSNGEIDVWMDGEQVLSVDGFKFVTNNKGIDALMFSTFHGGSSSDWWPNQEQYSYFDDFVVTTNPDDVGL